MPSHGAIVITIDLSAVWSSVLNQAKDFIMTLSRSSRRTLFPSAWLVCLSGKKKICDLTNDRNQFRSLVRKMEVGDTLATARAPTHGSCISDAESGGQANKTLKYAYTIVLTDGEWTLML